MGFHHPATALPREGGRHLFRVTERRIYPRREHVNTVGYIASAVKEHCEDRLRPRCPAFGRSTDHNIAFSRIPCGTSARVSLDRHGSPPLQMPKRWLAHHSSDQN